MKKDLMVLIGLLLVSVCVGARGQEPQKIELRMQPGDSATYTLHAETTTEYAAYRARGTVKRTTVFKSDMLFLIRCTELSADGVIHVEIMYPDFTLETSVTERGQTSKIVSDRDGARSYVDGKLQEQATWENLEKQGRPNLKKLLSSIIKFTLDSTGKVLDVEAPKELGTSFAGADLKQFFQHQVIFPPVAVAPGAEWNETRKREVQRVPRPLGGKTMLDEVTYKYERNETAMGRQCARIAMVATTRPSEEIPDLKEFKQTNEGWSLISLDNGQLILSEMKLSQETAGTPQGIRHEAKTTGVVRTSLVQPSSAEKKPAADTK